MLENRINKLYYDRIVLNEDDLREIDNFLRGIDLSKQEGNPISIIEGVVTLNIHNTTADYYFKVEDDFSVTIAGLTDDGREIYKGKVKLTKNGMNTNVMKKLMDFKTTKNAIEVSYRYLMDFFMYTHLNQKTTKKVIKKNPLLSVGVKKQSSRKHIQPRRSVVKVSKGKTIYEHKNSVEEQLKAEKRKYQRNTDSWRVRGHYRTYKSGKKVWIKPQVRGKGKTKGKDYTI